MWDAGRLSRGGGFLTFIKNQKPEEINYLISRVKIFDYSKKKSEIRNFEKEIFSVPSVYLHRIN
jgi:hypothetical protein